MFKIAIKDLKLFFADKKAVMLTFLMPMGLITLFVFAFGGDGNDNEIPEMKVIISDQSNDSLSQMICANIDALPSLKIERMEWDSARAKVSKGDRVAALLIADHFLDSVRTDRQGFVYYFDRSRLAEASMIRGTISGELFSVLGGEVIGKQISRQLRDEMGMTDSASIQGIQQMVGAMMGASAQEDPMSDLMKVEEVSSPAEVSPALIHSVGGTAVMTLLFSVAAMGAGLLDEKEKGTLRRLLFAPVNPMQLLFGKMVSAVIIGFIQLTLMLIFSWMFFGLDLFINLPAILICILLTSVTCASFGVFIASICTSRKQVEGLSTIVVLVMSAIGGSMMPTFFMPEFMQRLSMFSVNYWSIQAFYDIFWRDFSWADFGLKMMVLLAISGTMLALSAAFFRKNILRIS